MPSRKRGPADDDAAAAAGTVDRYFCHLPVAGASDVVMEELTMDGYQLQINVDTIPFKPLATEATSVTVAAR